MNYFHVTAHGYYGRRNTNGLSSSDIKKKANCLISLNVSFVCFSVKTVNKITGPS